MKRAYLLTTALVLLAGHFFATRTTAQQTPRPSENAARAERSRGLRLYGAGRFEEAEASFARASALEPRSADLQYLLALCHEQMGRHDEAARALREAVRLRPDFAEAHNALGVVDFNAGRRREAETSFRRALGLRADYPAARFNLGVVELVSKDRDAAIAQYRVLKTLNADLARQLHKGLFGEMLLELNERGK